jgi:methylated-DNA-[protein]-cysteine S-methyltransferase
MNLSRSVLESPFGPLSLVASERGLAAVLWPDGKHPRKSLADLPEAKRHPILRESAHQLREYFGGARKAFELPLDPSGSAFELRVWQGLRGIGYGATLSYGALARALGSPKSARAVGGAAGRNPIAIVVPCHRLVGADGSLTGFAGGLGAKQWLLNFESGFDTKRKELSAKIMHDDGAARNPATDQPVFHAITGPTH